MNESNRDINRIASLKVLHVCTYTLIIYRYIPSFSSIKKPAYQRGVLRLMPELNVCTCMKDTDGKLAQKRHVTLVTGSL